MKKKYLYLIMISLIVLALGIVTIDYYRAVYVSNSNNLELNDVNDESSIQVENDLPRKGEASLLFLGDNLIHESVLRYANTLAGGNGSKDNYHIGFDFKPLYENVLPLIEKSDFTVCNQSSLVGAEDSTESYSGYPLFNSPSALGVDLIEIGVDAVNIANNHALDLGIRGYQESVQFWKEQNISLFGGYLSKEEMNSVENKMVEINGIKVAFLSYTANTNGLYDNNESGIPYFTVNGTAIRTDLLVHDITKGKEISDIVIVMVNWANAAGFEILDFQKEASQIMCDAGADVIIGSGPKTIQSIEWLQGKNGNKTLCAYSLGNFMGTMNYTENLLGGALEFSLKKTNETATIGEIVFHPLVIHYTEDYSEIYTIPLADYTPERFDLHGSNLKFGMTDFQVLTDTVKKYISSEFLL